MALWTAFSYRATGSRHAFPTSSSAPRKLQLRKATICSISLERLHEPEDARVRYPKGLLADRRPAP